MQQYVLSCNEVEYVLLRQAEKQDKSYESQPLS